MSSEKTTVSKHGQDESLTCKQFISALAEYLARELSSSSREQMDLHLAVCPDCVRYLASYEVTIKLGKKAMAEDDEHELPEGFVDVVLSATRKRS
jgi:hypothetical protein